jgi:hypothetical protein
MLSHTAVNLPMNPMSQIRDSLVEYEISFCGFYASQKNSKQTKQWRPWSSLSAFWCPSLESTEFSLMPIPSEEITESSLMPTPSQDITESSLMPISFLSPYTFNGCCFVAMHRQWGTCNKYKAQQDGCPPQKKLDPQCSRRRGVPSLQQCSLNTELFGPPGLRSQTGFYITKQPINQYKQWIHMHVWKYAASGLGRWLWY